MPAACCRFFIILSILSRLRGNILISTVKTFILSIQWQNEFGDYKNKNIARARTHINIVYSRAQNEMRNCENYVQIHSF